MKGNAVTENIRNRRSIRSFTDEAIPHEDLQTIVECAQWAPSAMNRQEWCFVVVEDKDRITKLCDAMAEELARESYDMYGPVAIIIVGHRKGEPFGREDDGCAMQTIFLAAYSLGVGSCWLNQLQGICDAAGVRAQLDALGMPGDFEVHGIAALGYAAAEGKDQPRKSTVVWD